MPVVILFQVVALVMPVLALIVMPYYWFQTKGIIVSGSIIVSVFLVIFVIAIGKDLSDKLSKPGTLEKEPGLGKLLTTYIKAKKSKICPLIQWKESK